jgi:hypothetical protein
MSSLTVLLLRKEEISQRETFVHHMKRLHADQADPYLFLLSLTLSKRSGRE